MVNVSAELGMVKDNVVVLNGVEIKLSDSEMMNLVRFIESGCNFVSEPKAQKKVADSTSKKSQKKSSAKQKKSINEDCTVPWGTVDGNSKSGYTLGFTKWCPRDVYAIIKADFGKSIVYDASSQKLVSKSKKSLDTLRTKFAIVTADTRIAFANAKAKAK